MAALAEEEEAVEEKELLPQRRHQLAEHVVRDDAAPRRVAELLRSRLRRAVAAPNVGREAVPATNGSADEPSKPGGEPAAQRFMLHLLAENLDYVLEALGPVI